MRDLFRDFIEFGRETMQGVRAKNSEAVRYKWLLGEINELFVKAHGIVLKKLEAIEEAKAVGAAQCKKQQRDIRKVTNWGWLPK